MKHILLFLTLLTGIHAANALNYKDIKVTQQKSKKLKCLSSHISFVYDMQGTPYVVKQYKQKKRKVILPATIAELVALDMGQALGISLDRACLIPAGVDFPGKDFTLPATLHTYVAGNSFRGYKGEQYKNLTIFQHTNQGLTREIIYQMSRNKDLPAIVALDTFVGNSDRGRHNFFYHQSTDSFVAIDMGATFKKDFCNPSIKNIQALSSDSTTCLSEDEKAGLKIYYQTLKQLVEQFPPDILCAQLDTYAHQAGFFDETFFTLERQQQWAACFARYKRCIHTTYPHAQALLSALEELFQIQSI